MHDLACQMVFENSSIMDLIEEKETDTPLGSGNYEKDGIRTSPIRPWDEIKKINQRLKNLEASGNIEDSDPKEKGSSNSPSKSLPNQTEKFDITTLNKNAYEKKLL